MAFFHIYFNSQSPYGAQLRGALNFNEQADRSFAAVRDVMVQMIDGDGSQDAHYAEITSRFGFLSDADAHAAFSEIDSAYSKTSGNASVSAVRAARDQLISRLR